MSLFLWLTDNKKFLFIPVSYNLITNQNPIFDDNITLKIFDLYYQSLLSCDFKIHFFLFSVHCHYVWKWYLPILHYTAQKLIHFDHANVASSFWYNHCCYDILVNKENFFCQSTILFNLASNETFFEKFLSLKLYIQ